LGGLYKAAGHELRIDLARSHAGPYGQNQHAAQRWRCSGPVVRHRKGCLPTPTEKTSAVVAQAVQEVVMPKINIPSLSTLPCKYPLIYRAFYRCRRYPRHPIAYWGFECGDGWFSIIDELSAWLENEALALKAAGKRVPIVVQVKEKFGALRFYVRHFPKNRFFDELNPRLEVAELKSKTVCEECGQPVKLQQGYLQTLCEEHARNMR
jgi:hypothetical protein